MVRRLTFVSALIAVALAAPPVSAQVEDYTPVTDAMLQDPDPSDWLSWRRTLDGQAHSPLDQIDTGNVGDLRLVWSWALRPGPQQTTPLVHDGVLYIANPGEIVQALDAATGDLVWEYDRGAEAPGNSFGGAAPRPHAPQHLDVRRQDLPEHRRRARRRHRRPAPARRSGTRTSTRASATSSRAARSSPTAGWCRG